MPEPIAAAVASERPYGLAEGPLWDPARERVLWVDINAGNVHVGALAGGTVQVTETISVGDVAAAVVSSPDGELLVARRRDVVRLTGARRRSVVAELVPADRDSRLNDGACDPAGRFLIGSMSLDGRRGGETLWRLEPDGAVTSIDDDLTLSNGLAWSPDGATLYSIDTTPGIVWARPYDTDTGGHAHRTAALRIAGGSPDGMCVDADGNLWIAIWGAGEVRCLTPEGELLAIVELPAPHVSSVAFAGPTLDTLLITTAQEDLTAEQLRDHPLSGHLFTADVGVHGLLAPWWSAS